MAFELAGVVPWGRSFEEYVAMFSLGSGDLTKKILGCGDGPAGFNAALNRGKGSVVSVDPLYAFTTGEIGSRIGETFDLVLEQMRKNSDEFCWTAIPSVEALGEIRMKAMSDFLSDFASGKAEGRYVQGELPHLPFPDDYFDLALCSHFLFLYSAQFDLAFHLRSLKELCRVSAEVRVFPLLELGSVRSRHLDELLALLAAEGHAATVERVNYEFQKGGNEMLRITRKESRITAQGAKR
jgi:hypothetical protein